MTETSRPEDELQPAAGGDQDAERAGPAGASSGRRGILRWIERIVIAVLVVFVLVRLGPQLGALTGVGPDLGQAPSYELSTFGGEKIRSDDLLGRVVVLNFWATWCTPCRLEMPSLQSLHEDRADDGVVVIGLSTDVGRAASIEAFVDVRGYTYPVGRATNAHRQAFGGIRGIPTTFLIDRNGVVRHRVVGYFAPPALRAAVDRLLDEPAEPADGARP